MKRFIKFSAAALAIGAAATLAGCSGCSGCNKNTVNATLTNSNWYAGTSYKGIQPSFIIDEAHPEYTKEIIEYDVTFDGSAASNTTYSVNYKDGKFTTEFYATEYNWNNNPVYPEDKTEVVYVYKTELKISVEYTLKSTQEKSGWMDDSVATVSYFRAAGKNLTPVYSRQEIKSSSPASFQTATAAGMYQKVDELYENYYDFDCTEVTTLEGAEKTSHTLSFAKHKYSVFDNSSLYIAVRSMKLSPSMSQTVNLYSAAAGGVDDYRITGAEDSSIDEDRLKEISAELGRQGLFTPESDKPTVSTVAVNVNYAGGNLYGTTQTLWYAAIDKPDNNTPRTTMLKISVPLSYGLGKLEYNLKTIHSTIWNG